jgi:hypothetical protein
VSEKRKEKKRKERKGKEKKGRGTRGQRGDEENTFVQGISPYTNVFSSFMLESLYRFNTRYI